MSSPRPADPLSRLSQRELRRLARRAARQRATSPEGFEALAASLNVTTRALRLLSDAWSAGGARGVDALGPAPRRAPDAEMVRALLATEVWRHTHYPAETLLPTVWRNRLTLERIAPGTRQPQPLLQLRHNAGGWHLYRRAAQGEWWPVPVAAARRRWPGRPRSVSLEACLDTVRSDLTAGFWSASRRREIRLPSLEPDSRGWS